MTAAADARALVAAARLATLASVDRDSGAPFASLVAAVDDGAGHPLMLLSGLAEHTRNLSVRADASLLVVGPGADPSSLDRPRVTLVGQIAWLDGDDATRAVDRLTAALPEARTWAALPDFRPARLVVQQVRFVGGFARAAKVPLAEYLAR